MKKLIAAAALVALVVPAIAADKVSPDVIKKVIAASWKDPAGSNPKGAKPDWAARLVPDETLKVCSDTLNKPSKAQGDAIVKAAKASIKYPADGKFMGDWKKGEKIAQDGRGGRYNDKVGVPSGANCYACHQIDPAELSFGTIGPSLAGYGKKHMFKASEVKIAYEQIYNSHSAHPCSHMPRFGANGVLTMDQIKDLVALLMSPDSPVNK